MRRRTISIDGHTYNQHTTFTAVPGGLLVETAVIGSSSWRPAAASVFVPCDDLEAHQLLSGISVETADEGKKDE